MFRRWKVFVCRRSNRFLFPTMRNNLKKKKKKLIVWCLFRANINFVEIFDWKTCCAFICLTVINRRLLTGRRMLFANFVCLPTTILSLRRKREIVHCSFFFFPSTDYSQIYIYIHSPSCYDKFPKFSNALIIRQYNIKILWLSLNTSFNANSRFLRKLDDIQSSIRREWYNNTTIRMEAASKLLTRLVI